MSQKMKVIIFSSTTTKKPTNFSPRLSPAAKRLTNNQHNEEKSFVYDVGHHTKHHPGFCPHFVVVH